MELSRRPRMSRLGFSAVVLCCAAALPRHGWAAEDLAREAAALKTGYAADLGRLAAWCREKNLSAEAKTTTDLVAPPDPHKIVLPVLPGEIGSFQVRPGLSGDAAAWHRRLWKLRQDYAAALFALATRCVGRRQASLAYRLALDAIGADPDHEGARRVFGYQKYGNQWHTPYEAAMLRGGMVWNERFGWIEKANLPRYQRGQRLLGVTWIDAANDDTLHAKIANGWDIETEHYRIRTNHSIEAAAALGAKLENLHRIWRQVFLGYYASQADIEALFSDKPPRGYPAGSHPEGTRQGATQRVPATDHGPRTTDILVDERPIIRAATARLDVVYFRDKEQYCEALKPSVPEIGISTGLYVAENRIAYFFAGSEDSERTMYHEATHQLFWQSRRVGRDVGCKANCWLLEGIAMYMETLRRQRDCFVLGGLDDARLEAARYHLEKKDFYVPFEKLVRMGVRDVQGHPEITKLYSQVAAMTSFLMHYGNGRYRDALVGCLAAVYDGSQDPDLLARTTGSSYSELDKQYKEYMRGNSKSETNSESKDMNQRNHE